MIVIGINSQIYAAQDNARHLRYTVFSSEQVLPRHLRHAIYSHAGQLLSRQDVHALLADLAERAPVLVAELIGYDPRHHLARTDPANTNSLLSVAQIHKVLQDLLAQRIPICDLESILEALGDALASAANPDEFTTLVRRRLAPTITQEFSAPDGRLHCLLLEPSAEKTLTQQFHRPSINGFASATGQESCTAALSTLTESIIEYIHALPVLPEPLVLLVDSAIRHALADALSSSAPNLPVLARSEIRQNAPVHILASFDLPQSQPDRPVLLAQQTMELFS